MSICIFSLLGISHSTTHTFLPSYEPGFAYSLLKQHIILLTYPHVPRCHGATRGPAKREAQVVAKNDKNAKQTKSHQPIHPFMCQGAKVPLCHNVTKRPAKREAQQPSTSHRPSASKLAIQNFFYIYTLYRLVS